jgi:hypothetical protein
MASSLYYFLPGPLTRRAGTLPTPCCSSGRPASFVWESSYGRAEARALAEQQRADRQYLPWIGLYLFLMMLSSALEIVLISRGRYFWASAMLCPLGSGAGGGLSPAGAAVSPTGVAPEGRRLRGVSPGALTLFYFRREFRGGFTPDRALLKSQLAYALPFAAAVFVEIVQASLPQYAVSHLFDPATFAIFAVGCLQIPLVDFAASPTSDVMMVKMQERLAEGRKPAVLAIWHDTTWKLACAVLSAGGVLRGGARQIIVLLFTEEIRRERSHLHGVVQR